MEYIYPFVQYGSSTYPRTKPLLTDPEQLFRNIKNFNSKETDVILCSPMKSGSHWCYEIISMLLTGSTDYNAKGLLVGNNLESFEDFDSISAFKDPRLFHTHLPYHLLPQKHIKNEYKIVYLNRNPKDRCVSQYTFLQGKKGVPDWTWNYFFDNFVTEDTLYGGWFNFTKEFEDAAKCNKGVFPVTFESLKLNPFGTTIRMAEFLAVPYTDSLIKDIVDKCSFGNLKENKYDVTQTIDTKSRSTLWRKGVIGDWKNWFTIEQNEKFDKLYNEEMKNYTVRFIYND